MIKKQVLFEGAATALITPMRGDGSLDLPALERLIENQLDGGIAALIACGTTGEPATLTYPEWETVVGETVRLARGRVPVIAGTGGNNTADTILRAKRAKALGADAQLCVTPYYNKTSQEGLLLHYKAIVEQSALPIILYSVPSRTGMQIAVETLVRLAEMPQIIALKEAGGDIGRVADIRDACGDALPIYCGSDEMTVPMLSLGAKGVISVLSNLLPQPTAQMAELYLNGKVQDAADLQLRYIRLIRLLFKEVSPIPVKAAMSMLGLCEDALRLPLTPMTEGNRALLKNELIRLGVLA
ncbi:MAG: 4-hydroxy-tetrahydrodipicolinate synthase [Clostridia bacterium]|nr:4-hydroxy-tetrahydrodipicolinate synthase [Clostridia bacterium]